MQEEKNFGAIFQAWREKCGLGIEDMAAIQGIPAQALRRVETGDCTVEAAASYLDAIFAIDRPFNFSKAWLALQRDMGQAFYCPVCRTKLAPSKGEAAWCTRCSAVRPIPKLPPKPSKQPGKEKREEKISPKAQDDVPAQGQEETEDSAEPGQPSQI